MLGQAVCGAGVREGWLCPVDVEAVEGGGDGVVGDERARMPDGTSGVQHYQGAIVRAAELKLEPLRSVTVGLVKWVCPCARGEGTVKRHRLPTPHLPCTAQLSGKGP